MTWLNRKVVQPNTPAGRFLREDVVAHLTNLGYPEWADHSGYQGSSEGQHHFAVILDPMAKKPCYEFSIPYRPETEPGQPGARSVGSIAREIIEQAKARQAMAKQTSSPVNLLMRY